MEFLIALFSIMLVNIILSGDNAVVIAMASRCLPPKQQKMAILWGSAGAIGLRVVLTLVAVKLLEIPYLQFGGGVLLVWIAAKLLLEDKSEGDIAASDSMWPAIKTIIVADVVMSLDNTLAIAAVANGHYVLLAVGLALSIPLIIGGSQIIVLLMDKYPIIIYGGAALIAWTSGEMIIKDPQIGVYILEWMPHRILPGVITIGVVGAGYWQRKKRQRVQPPSGSAG